jgi:hypothetical protein
MATGTPPSAHDAELFALVGPARRDANVTSPGAGLAAVPCVMLALPLRLIRQNLFGETIERPPCKICTDTGVACVVLQYPTRASVSLVAYDLRQRLALLPKCERVSESYLLGPQIGDRVRV